MSAVQGVTTACWVRRLLAAGIGALGGLLCAVPASADPADAPSVASRAASSDQAFRWEASPVTLPSGGQGEVVVHLQVPEGFHVYAEDITLQVVDAQGLRVGDLKVVGEPGAHRTGTVAVVLPVSARGVSPGLLTLTLEGTVHGCAASRCQGSSQVPIEVLVNIAPRDTAAGP